MISVRFLGGYQNCSDFMHYSLWFSKVIFCDMKSIQSLPKNCTSGIDNSLQHINVENMLKSMHSFVIKIKFPDITYVWDIQNMECTIYVFRAVVSRRLVSFLAMQQAPSLNTCGTCQHNYIERGLINSIMFWAFYYFRNIIKVVTKYIRHSLHIMLQYSYNIDHAMLNNHVYILVEINH